MCGAVRDSMLLVKEKLVRKDPSIVLRLPILQEGGCFLFASASLQASDSLWSLHVRQLQWISNFLIGGRDILDGFSRIYNRSSVILAKGQTPPPKAERYFGTVSRIEPFEWCHQSHLETHQHYAMFAMWICRYQLGAHLHLLLGEV